MGKIHPFLWVHNDYINDTYIKGGINTYFWLECPFDSFLQEKKTCRSLLVGKIPNFKTQDLEKVTELKRTASSELVIPDDSFVSMATPLKTNGCPLKINGWFRCIPY